MLSLCTIALNEQDFIGEMLRTVKPVVDEIVIAVDDRTTDDTERIARENGAETFRFSWQDDFAAARNLSIAHAHGDWILVLDPDERLTVVGNAVVLDLLNRVQTDMSAVTGFMFGYADLDLEGTCHYVSRSSVRMFRRLPEIQYVGVVHEEPFYVTAPEQANWVAADGVISIVHFGHDPRIVAARGKQERNQRLLERRLSEDPDDVYAKTKLREMLETSA